MTIVVNRALPLSEIKLYRSFMNSVSQIQIKHPCIQVDLSLHTHIKPWGGVFFMPLSFQSVWFILLVVLSL